MYDNKLIATFKALNVLVCTKPGKYNVNIHKVVNSKIATFMVCTIMSVDDGGYYTISDINSSMYLFPFEYKIEKETILEDNRFTINNFGGEVSIALTE